MCENSPLQIEPLYYTPTGLLLVKREKDENNPNEKRSLFKFTKSNCISENFIAEAKYSIT